MIRQKNSQQCLRTKKPRENLNRSPSKKNVCDIFSSEKKIEQSSLALFQSFVSNNPNEPATSSLNCNELNQQHNERMNFVKMCRQKCDRSDLPANFDQWSIEQQHEHLTNNVDKYFPNIPASLRYTLPAAFKDGDCGRSTSERPDWLDMNKFRRGQKFALDYFIGICVSQMLSMFYLLSFKDGLKTMILSRKSDTPYRAFKRYRSTLIRINRWYTEDPWDQGTQAHRDIQKVRKMHLAMRQRLCSYDDEQIDTSSQISHAYCPMWKTTQEDFRDTCPMAMDLQCPFTMMQLRNINQGDMSCTQCGFMGLIVLHPEKFGVHGVCDEDLEAFCHVWRGLGYLLGIEDRYNFCRGSLKEVRERMKDFLEQWVKPNLRSVPPEWEHMSICLYKGLRYFLAIASYRVYLLYFCDILDLKMPRLYGALRLVEKALYVLLNLLFGYLMRLPAVVHFMNAFLYRDLHLAMKFEPEKHYPTQKEMRFNIDYES